MARVTRKFIFTIGEDLRDRSEVIDVRDCTKAKLIYTMPAGDVNVDLITKAEDIPEAAIREASTSFVNRTAIVTDLIDNYVQVIARARTSEDVGKTVTAYLILE
ncbi:hypothetical protein HMPREF9374_1119 [Desmospora sp. 8437]|nr:hypothetical protein HMPREF9374_1119 [Desmospora sp. 8437]